MPKSSSGSVRSIASTSSRQIDNGGSIEENVTEEEHLAGPSEGSNTASTSRVASDEEGDRDDSASEEESEGDEEETDVDDDEEDEEPTLRYSRIATKAANDIFARDSCSALAVSDCYLVVGTHNGGVVVFARPGSPAALAASTAATNGKGKGKGKEKEKEEAQLPEDVEEGSIVIKRYRPHTASVNDIVIDEESQYIGSASTDGTLCIHNFLYGKLMNLYLHFRQSRYSSPLDIRCTNVRPETNTALSGARAFVRIKVHQTIRFGRNGRLTCSTREGVARTERCDIA